MTYRYKTQREIKDEMALLDQQGPLARAAISESPLDIDLRKLLSAFRDEDSNRRSRAMVLDEDENARIMAALEAGRDARLAEFIRRSWKGRGLAVAGVAPLAQATP